VVHASVRVLSAEAQLKFPQKVEFVTCGSGLRHVPTAIRVQLAYQNVEGGWTLSYLRGNAGEYDEQMVVQFAGDLLLA
jgi:hypothetical protein